MRKIPVNQRVNCADCGRASWRSRTSAAVPRCLPCRRAARGLAPDQLVRDLLAQPKPRGLCHECGVPVIVEPGSKRWKYCSDQCFRRVRNRRGSGTVAKSGIGRGYDTAHQRLRKQLLPFAYDTPCALCGVVMHEGEAIDLDHTEDRTGYRGFSHASCNRTDGARRGGEAYRQRVLGGRGRSISTA